MPRRVLLSIALELESLAVGDVDKAGGREAVGSVLGAAEDQAAEDQAAKELLIK